MSLYPVLCKEDIPLELLNRFFALVPPSLNLYLITSTESLSQPPKGTRAPIEPFEKPNPLVDASKIHSSISTDVQIYFDKRSLQDNTVCIDLSWLDKPRGFIHADISVAPRAIERLIKGEVLAPTLRNVGALEGGPLRGQVGDTTSGRWEAVLDEDFVVNASTKEVRDKVEGIRPLKQKRANWTQWPKNVCNLAVFITADISTEYLTTFLKHSYNFDGHEDGKSPLAVFMDSLDIDELHPASSATPVKALSHNPFIGIPMATIDNFVKNNFPGTDYHCRMYLVLDERTEKEDSLIIADNGCNDYNFEETVGDDRPQFRLLRSRSKGAFSSAVGCAGGGNISTDKLIESAQENGGVENIRGS